MDLNLYLYMYPSLYLSYLIKYKNMRWLRCVDVTFAFGFK